MGPRRQPSSRRDARARQCTARAPASRRFHTTRAGAIEIQELDSARVQLEGLARRAAPRWNAEPDDVRRSVAKLVLTLVEFIRQLLERQAIRRMDAGTLSPEETEAVGLALMRLEETVQEIGARFGLAPEDLNLDLGPIGRLM